MFLNNTELQRPCTRCGDAEATVVIEAVPSGPPLPEAGELCPVCAGAVLGVRTESPDPLADLARMDPADRLRRIEWTRRSIGDELDALRSRTVAELRRRGWSWRQIGDAGGVTRARAQQLGAQKRSPAVRRRPDGPGEGRGMMGLQPRHAPRLGGIGDAVRPVERVARARLDQVP